MTTSYAVTVLASQGDPFDFPADDGGGGHQHESSNEDLPSGKGTKPAAVSRKIRPVGTQPQQQQPSAAAAQVKAQKVYGRSKPAKALSAHAEEDAAPAAQAAAKRGKTAADEEPDEEEAAQDARETQGRQKAGLQHAAAAKRPATAKAAARGLGANKAAEEGAESSRSSGEEGDEDSDDDSSSEDEYQPTQKSKRQRARDDQQVCAPPVLPTVSAAVQVLSAAGLGVIIPSEP